MGNPFPSDTELAIMRLLKDHGGEGMYGLEIVRASESLDKPLARGTVYTTLGRMDEKGLVRSRAKPGDHSGLPRPRYRLSAVGEKVLAAAEVMGLALQEG